MPAELALADVLPSTRPRPDKSFPPFDDKTPIPLPTLPYGGDTEPQLHWPIDW